MDEYFTDGSVEELCDIEEVIRALIEFKQVPYEEFNSRRESKCEKRGAFKDRVFLESTK